MTVVRGKYVQTIEQEPRGDFLANQDDLILVTGATGFIGSNVVARLLERGFRNLRCFVRPSSSMEKLDGIKARWAGQARIEVVKGNLLSRADCESSTKDASIIYHLAAGAGEKSYPDAFMNSVVTTRNLLDACVIHRCLRRFVNVSSFTVYSNEHRRRGRVLDESCPVEQKPQLRGDAYCYAKVKQDEMVIDYGKRHGAPYVIIRPGSVYGPGKAEITGRVGVDTFGVFLHLGGSNHIPFTYVDNCADAIVLAGLTRGVEQEVFNVVDDSLPSSRKFVRLYKHKVKRFRSIYVPHAVSYTLCALWEKYSEWSEGQLPPVFNRKRWHVEWKKTYYSNAKLKQRLGWFPKVSMEEGLRRYLESCREATTC